MVPDPDYYELLGVAPDASAEEIKAAHRRVVVSAHPDKGGTDGLFHLVTRAYETLSDPTERAAYDAIRNGPGSDRVTDVTNDDNFHHVSDPGWGAETTWNADRGFEVKKSPRIRLLAWAARSRSAHHAKRVSKIAMVVLFATCLTVLLIPDLIRPDRAEPDAFMWLLQLPPVTAGLAGLYLFFLYPRDMGVLEASVLPHGIVAIGLIAWPFAYGDIATAAERWTYGGLALAWLLYLVALFIIGVVNEAEQRAARGRI
ncbi:DnaJ-like protein [Haloactinopolyspora alba]|uniref:DnaJ-like protein n=1 Tax=Haloactinopolyspora alba TaxID=648780 RepID=A0A2P8DVX7_9ACTN|nr:J domain-containing protein [Haloactinopolyspora alba]PSL01366.1 DnaJ-like protein [Haloactinopolyspora alba]